ncbi:MAG: hypothetical protein BroJett021_40470 [Chloroflexota bacterium]|nr:MAG: hypothetical protein BroJett021_40470 [Chloroflexota bacterium]
MNNTTSLSPTSNHHPTDLISVLLEVERPSSAELAPYSRAERYRRLRANTEAHRARLQHWIDRHNLSDEVLAVSPATGFNLLFVQCTPHAARELANAPGVVDVLSADQ